ncbi:thioredoxin family protein [Sulfurimonas sp.]
MKTIILTLILISSLYSVELDWSHDYHKALEQAKKEKKDVYIFVGADVCRFCDLFKKVTLSKKEVMDRLKEDYIPVYLSRDRHFIPKHFAIKGVPRHYFLTPNGDVIHDDRGSREPAGFFDILDEVELKKND